MSMIKKCTIRAILYPPIPNPPDPEKQMATAKLVEDQFFINNKAKALEMAHISTLGCLATEHILRSMILTEEIKDHIQALVYSPDPVMICGRSGTGKSTIAKALHGRRYGLYGNDSGKFVEINTTALPAELIESELLGHERGAFTGAHLSRMGKFALADKGTVFLDEIGDMPISLQAKLLKVVEEKQWYPLGGDDPRNADFRIICATNKNPQEVLREDLYYRLCAHTITLPDVTLSVAHTYITNVIRRMPVFDKKTDLAFQYITNQIIPSALEGGGFRYLNMLIKRATIIAL